MLSCLNLIPGDSVTVLRPVQDGTDSLGCPIFDAEEEAVGCVLFTPGATADLDASRPEGARVDATFHFPAGYGQRLKGCSIRYRGRVFRVIGDPVPYMEENCPGPYGLAVETEEVHG